MKCVNGLSQIKKIAATVIVVLNNLITEINNNHGLIRSKQYMIDYVKLLN